MEQIHPAAVPVETLVGARNVSGGAFHLAQASDRGHLVVLHDHPADVLATDHVFRADHFTLLARTCADLLCGRRAGRNAALVALLP